MYLKLCWNLNCTSRYLGIDMGTDNHFTIIREKGRKTFLVSSPDNFIGILHDYSDKSKGFVFWKTALEEKLI